MPRHTAVWVAGCVGCVILNSGCAVHSPELTLVNPQWVCEFRSALHGPIDDTLPPYAEIWAACVCPNQAGRVAITWIRSLDTGRLEWDKDEEVWRVKGSDIVVKPRKPPDVMDETPGVVAYYVASPDDFLEPGQVIGACIVRDDAVEYSGFLPGVGVESLFPFLSVPLTGVGNGWCAALPLWPWHGPLNPDTHGIAMAGLSRDGWEIPRMTIPLVLPFGSVYPYSEGEGIDLFWVESYWRRFDLPDFLGGRQRFRINHVRVEHGKRLGFRHVYEHPHSRIIWDEDRRFVDLGGGCYDMVFRRSSLLDDDEAPDQLLHIRDLLSGRRLSPRRFAECQIGSEIAILPLPGQRIQVVWLEERLKDVDRPESGVTRLVEAYFDGQSWSHATTVSEAPGWNYASLAATVVPRGDQPVVLAVWQDREGSLTYSSSTRPHEWCKPVTTDVDIGWKNWLAGDEDGLVLVTKTDDNLYWYSFELSPIEANAIQP